MITEWVKEVARTPVLVKLTPNITDIRAVARAARRGGADALSAINTINSITGIDLDTLTPRPNVGGYSAHGGYCGPAVKPIALHLVQQIACRPGGGAADLGHRRHLRLARSGGVHAAGLRHGAGVHGGDALRLSHRRGHDRRPEQLDGRERLPHDRRFPRPVAAQGHGVEASGSELQDCGAHQSRQVHRLRPVLHRLLGWRAPVHSPRRPRARRRRSKRASRARIATTPIAKLDAVEAANGAHARRSASRAWTKRNAWAAIYAGWCARWRVASPWSRWRRGSRRSLGKCEAEARRDFHRRDAEAQRRIGPADCFSPRLCVSAVNTYLLTCNTLIRNGTVVTARETGRPMS